VWDLTFTVPALPPQPRKVIASSLQQGGGGMAATAAVAVATLGGEVEYWGRLGDDVQGRQLRSSLESHRVRVRAVGGAETQTPISAVLVAEGGERMLAAYRGQLDDAADWLPLGQVEKAHAVLADFRWPQGAGALFRAALARDIPRVLDANIGGMASTRALLPLASHTIFSQAGLAEMAGHDDLDGGLRDVARLTRGVVAVTCGELGSRFLVDGMLHTIGAFTVVARDTNGAGDVFHGAYALALAEGIDTISAARFAAAAAALKCSNGSGWSAMPDRAAVDQLLSTPA
jgi:sulfofructose kinase